MSFCLFLLYFLSRLLSKIGGNAPSAHLWRTGNSRQCTTAASRQLKWKTKVQIVILNSPGRVVAIFWLVQDDIPSSECRTFLCTVEKNKNDCLKNFLINTNCLKILFIITFFSSKSYCEKMDEAGGNWVKWLIATLPCPPQSQSLKI